MYNLEMCHSDLQKDCIDANIDSWIKGEARKILQKSLGRVSI
ncbi:hypothetical protein S40293_09881 [Stachybotrys chartarum IBT 40293]|nr:hypothetical protein S40293_09881 [Stachybotrys chartarum IBT 40293]